MLLSDDGSHTLVSEKFGTSYHSTYGAITESNVVFIQAGLDHYRSENLDIKSFSVFEMGFGTGLNAFLSAIWANKNQVQLHYHSIEAFPVKEEEYNRLNYQEILNAPLLFKNILDSSWDISNTISEQFQLLKINSKLETYSFIQTYDIIFYDAFGPGTQEELWEKDITDKLFNQCNPGGILTTYCAKGSFKRNLRASGFLVEGLPGPPGKREITRAKRPK